MDFQPTLVGERLLLRPLKPDDFEALYQAASDPLIWEIHPQPDRYKREVFKEFFEEALLGGASFVVVDKRASQDNGPTNEKIIGTSRFYDLNPNYSDVSIGYTFLTREYWGGAYNREMKDLMLAHAFKYVDKVLFHVGEKNFRSQKAMLKIGGRFLEHIEKYKQRPDGSWRSTLVYVVEKA